MEPKHITEGQITIDIREYRELVEEAAQCCHYLNECYRLTAELARLKEEKHGKRKEVSSDH